MSAVQRLKRFPINSLSHLPKLRVMARSTVFRYKGQTPDPQKVGSDLNVRTVLTGRVVQRGDLLVPAMTEAPVPFETVRDSPVIIDSGHHARLTVSKFAPRPADED